MFLKGVNVLYYTGTFSVGAHRFGAPFSKLKTFSEVFSIFSSNILLYIGKNPVGKLCKVLKMEVKTYTPVGLKFVF